MKRELIVIPKIKIHPTKIILFNEIHWTPSKPTKSNDYQQNTTLITKEVDGKLEFVRVNTKFLNSKRVCEGELSKQAKKKLKLSIDYFLMINKPNSGKSGNTGRHYSNRIGFITLTLPSKQIHSDNEIKEKCLNQFLIEISKYHHVTNYIWRAEYQKNGNIHFHILVNRFIGWNDIRNRWNRIINKLGYVDRYRKELTEYHKNGFQLRTDLLPTWPRIKQWNAYIQGLKTDWHNPNSIDVHGIKNITNLKSYITKYMTKTEQDNNLVSDKNETPPRNTGRIWAASTVFSNITGACTEVDNEIEENLRTLTANKRIRTFKTDYFTIIETDILDPENLKLLNLIALFSSYMFKTFGYSHQFMT